MSGRHWGVKETMPVKDWPTNMRDAARRREVEDAMNDLTGVQLTVVLAAIVIVLVVAVLMSGVGDCCVLP